MHYATIFLLTFATLATAAGADQFATLTIDVDSAKRTYHVHKPDTVTKPLPLVVVLHGGGGNGEGLKDTYGFKPFVADGQMIAVYPDSGSGGWLPDHVGFLDAVINQVLAREKVDRNRLFVTGASRGGLMTFVMTQKSKHQFAAVGTVIASYLQGLADETPLKKPIDFAMIAGTEDPLMPYAGGWGAMRKPKTTGDPGARVLPVEEVIASLVKLNGITRPPVVSSLPNLDPKDGCTNQVRLFTNPDTKRRIMLVKVIGGGHVVPGGRQYLPKSVIGPACSDFDHAKVMWEFFRSSGTGLAPSNVAVNESPPNADGNRTDTEKALRSRVTALFEATLAGDIAKCIDLSDPAVVAKTGRGAAEKFFRTLNGLMKFAKVDSGDHRINSVKIADKSARVQTQVRINGKWQPPGTEIWSLVDRVWRYQETEKK
jgi:polyhydroxybutyrate depolymerase